MTSMNPARWSIRWQIAALLIVTQVVAHLVTVITIDLSISRNGGGKNDLALSVSEPFLTALRFASRNPAGLGPHAFAGLVASDPRFRLSEVAPGGDLSTDPDLEKLIAGAVPGAWRGSITVRSDRVAGIFPTVAVGPSLLAAALPEGGWLVFEPGNRTLLENMPRAVGLMTLLFFALPLMLLSVWMGGALLSPMADLARGAERFASDIDAPAIPERGAAEVRLATEAFNRMRARLRKLVASRSQTLASIGHDLRTPLTRLRLRLEAVEQSDAMAAVEMEEDIRAMERMIDDALTFLRAEGRPLALAPIDVAVLARTIADDYADRGFDIAYIGPNRLTVEGDHDHLRRVIDNIVGNAAKFASHATIAVIGRPDGTVKIEVDDNGPGIPPDRREQALQPFSKVEVVRSGATPTTTGFGLGLAIAKDLVERHGGSLALSRNEPTGLRVSILLPPGVLPAAVTGAVHG